MLGALQAMMGLDLKALFKGLAAAERVVGLSVEMVGRGWAAWKGGEPGCDCRVVGLDVFRVRVALEVYKEFKHGYPCREGGSCSMQVVGKLA